MVVGPSNPVPLLAGKPLPSQLIGGPRVHPPIFRLGTLGAIPAAMTPAMASGTLFRGSPPSETVAGVESWLMLSIEYICPSYPPQKNIRFLRMGPPAVPP